MRRRDFFSTLLSAGALLALDPERLLWRPTKTIFIPPVSADPLDTLTLQEIRQSLIFKSFFLNNTKYLELRKRGFPIPVAFMNEKLGIPVWWRS